MTDEEEAIWPLLKRGGMRPSADPAERGHYDGTRDPGGVETLGRALADALTSSGSSGPTAIMVWEDVADAVLAHVVARELGASIVIAFDADGLVGHSGALERGARVALLTDTVDHPSTLEAMATYAGQCGAEVVALALLARPSDDVLPGVPTVALERLPAADAIASNPSAPPEGGVGHE